MIKKLKLLFVLFFLFVLKNEAQKMKLFNYYLNKDLASTEKENALFFGEGRYQNDLFKLDLFSADKKQLIATAHFSDSSLSYFDGLYSLFHANKKLEIEGNYKNGIQVGLWKKMDSIGRLVDSTIYIDGHKMVSAKFNYEEKGHLFFYSLYDSIKDTYCRELYDSLGVVTQKVDFKGNVGVIIEKTKEGIKIDTVFTREEIEAKFPGGPSAFIKYLQKNLKASTPAENGAPNGKYTVIVRFQVNVDGSLEEIVAETNAGYGTEKEAIRVIKNSLKWEPGIQFGKKVKSLKRQPLTFVVE
jgi:antitoxin component YwqK of YwqJK toxin-antitoxin module